MNTLPEFEVECAIVIDNTAVVAISDTHNTVIFGADAITGNRVVIELGNDPLILVALVEALQHYIKDHHNFEMPEQSEMIEDELDLLANHKAPTQVH